jgi:hypothetical protein
VYRRVWRVIARITRRMWRSVRSIIGATESGGMVDMVTT